MSDSVVRAVGRMVFHVARCVTHDQGRPHHQTIALAYTMFNVYYPKLWETGPRGDSTPTSLEGNLCDALVHRLPFHPESTVCVDDKAIR